MAKKVAKKKSSKKKVKTSKRKVKKKTTKKKVVAKKAVKKKKLEIKPGIHPNKVSLIYNSRLALRDLIIFACLSLLSLMLYLVSGNLFYQDLFYLLAMVFGFVALAFLIVFLALVFSRDKLRK